MKKIFLIYFSLTEIVWAIASGCQNYPACISCGNFPISTGQIVFHTYDQYGDGTSQIFLYKFNNSSYFDWYFDFCL